MIGKLYYVVHTRVDVGLAVGMVGKFLENPKEGHMMTVKRIMRYIKGTKDYGLWYKKGGNLDLKEFIDTD